MGKFFGILIFSSLLGCATAFADVPTRPGTVIKTEVSDDAAKILSAFLGQEPREFPVEIGTITVKYPDQTEDTFTAGVVGTQELPDSKISIGCVSAYHHGRKHQCSLVQTF